MLTKLSTTATTTAIAASPPATTGDVPTPDSTISIVSAAGYYSPVELEVVAVRDYIPRRLPRIIGDLVEQYREDGILVLPVPVAAKDGRGGAGAEAGLKFRGGQR
jgi:hypothetical protein